MTIYDLKPAFQNLLRPLCKSLVNSGMTANQVTLSALFLSVGWGGLIALYPFARWPLLGLPGVLFIRMALNAIDGMMAREHHQKSHLGAILNELGDVVSDAALYLPLALVPGFSPVLVVLMVLLSGLSEMAGVVAVQIGVARRYDGPFGKSDRAFVFGLLSFLVGMGVPTARWLSGILGGICGLLIITIWNRARRALQAAVGAPPSEPGTGVDQAK